MVGFRLSGAPFRARSRLRLPQALAGFGHISRVQAARPPAIPALSSTQAATRIAMVASAMQANATRCRQVRAVLS